MPKPKKQGWQNLEKWKKGLIVSSIVVVILVIVIAIPLVLLLPTNSSTPTLLTITTVDPIRFMCRCSTDGLNGRNENGDLILDSVIVENGLDSAENLALYKLTFPVGSSYYKDKWVLSEFEDWSDFVIKNSQPFQISGSGVLEITSDLPPVYLDHDLDVEGIVVRHGGVLFIKRGLQPIILKTGFILVESGGLLQAGSNFGDAKYRLGEPLTDWPIGSRVLDCFIKTPDTGYKHAGIITSQYSYRVYQPGSEITTPPQFSNYTGTNKSWENMFGPRIIANGFNGTMMFAGSIPELVDYTGTWSAKVVATGEDWIGKNDQLTLDNTYSPLNEIASSYSNTWCHLSGPSQYNKGDTQLVVEDDAKQHLSGWLPGYQILITCKTSEFCSTTNPDGRIPLWMDHQDSIERKANQDANESIPVIKDSDDGVEIATIQSVDPSTGIITLESGLQFRHLNNKVVLTRSRGGTVLQIVVDTRIHVALLSRSIRFSPEINSSGLGGGMNRWYYDVRDTINTTGPNGEWFGPGGSVVCNYHPVSTDLEEITHQCYDPIYNNAIGVDDHCQTLKPVADSNIRGHWMYGTSQIQSSNAIIGFQSMFRYGSNTIMDGCEFYRAGIPGNAGTVGQYPLHFHMTGFTKSFIAYLPEDANPQTGDRRDAVVANCSIHSSYNRWIVTHGAHEVTIRNNTGFICRGSGFFTEAGIEINNTWEHCLGAVCLPMQNDDYYNPCYLPGTNTYDGSQFIFAIVSSDLLFPSLWWFKSNQNRCLRNVGTNCISPVVGIWYTATNTANLRDIPNVLLGDQSRLLPALGDYINTRENLNQFGRGVTTGCWSTDNLKQALLSDQFGCVSFALDANSDVPLLCQAENIFYNCCGASSSFPDFAFSPYIQTTTPPFGPLVHHSGIPSFVPLNCQNGCSDSQPLAQASYFETLFGSGTWQGQYSRENFPYNYMPLNESEVAAFDAQGYTKNLTSKSLNIPFIMSGFLCFNLSALFGQLYAGPAWNKNSTTILINSCLLDHGGGTTFAATPTGAMDARATSSIWLTMCGDTQKQANIYHAFHNMIVDGSVAIPPNPTVFSGNKTFFSSRCSVGFCEYANNASSACLRFWMGDDLKIDIFPLGFFASQPNFPAGSNNIPVKIYELKTNLKYDAIFGITEPGSGSNFTPSSTRKYPFLCGVNGLFRDSSSQTMTTNPRFRDIVINTQIGLFLNDQAVAIGDHICNCFNRIIPNDL